MCVSLAFEFLGSFDVFSAKLQASSQATSSRRKHEDRKKVLMKKRVAARA